MSRTIRSPRPTRTILVQAVERDEAGNTHLVWDKNGNPVLEPFDQEIGRRRGLATRESQTTERRRRVNKRDRRDARLQLHRDPDSVELRQPRGRAISLAS